METIIITFNTMLIPGMYWMGIDKVLYSDKWNKTIITSTTGLVIIGIILCFLSGWDRLQLALAISFVFPLYHLLFYRGLRRFFIRRKKKEPVDVAFNFDSGLLADRTFALFFVLFSIFSSAIIIGLLIANYNNN